MSGTRFNGTKSKITKRNTALELTIIFILTGICDHTVNILTARATPPTETLITFERGRREVCFWPMPPFQSLRIHSASQVNSLSIVQNAQCKLHTIDVCSEEFDHRLIAKPTTLESTLLK